MKKIIAPALLGLLLVGSCNTLDVPDLNNPGLEGLRDNPTRGGVLAAATGLLIGTRVGLAPFNGLVSELGVFGRESYNFDPGDPRFVSELEIGPLDGGSPRHGGNLWAAPYANIRNANILVAATAKVVGVTAQEKEAILGFAQTIQAVDFLNVINTRDANGAPIAVDADPAAGPAPIATKPDVFAHIVNLLDSAATHLRAGGGGFPFPLSSGFTGFSSPPTFLKFNRALRARVAVYLGDFAGALALLGGGGNPDSTFVDTTAAAVDTLGLGGTLRTGVYNAYSTGSGDQTNGLFDPIEKSLFAHPSLETDAQLRVGGARGRRFTQKLRQLTVTNPKT
ncbi:MAG: RagB/SusD family nutrient uptake outer membrane protein, partial [Gemmatimonadales bacterium]